jgi:arginine utilization protein RocB
MLHEITTDIENILYPYVETESTTGTILERKAEKFLLNYLGNIDYFKKNQKYFGSYKVENDSLDRSVCYAMIKGDGDDTVVLIHHYDVVATEDFRLLKPFAYSPKDLELRLLKIKETLNEESKADLESGEFLFGRGTADMKGGGSIQLALIKKYSEIKNLKGNVLLIAVPDEENLSSGMRAAVKFLDEIKIQYKFNYMLMINSEPHQRKSAEVGILSEGSVGKLMPFVYVRGYLAHLGKVFEGFNPINLLCEIVRTTELNLELSDSVSNETSPPPTCLYLKDGKQHYDVSMCLSASACFNVLTLKKSPSEILDKLTDICNESFNKIILEMNETYSNFKRGMGENFVRLPWKPNVITFKNLYYEALNKYGDEFKDHYNRKLEELVVNLNMGKISMLQSNFNLIDVIYDYIDDLSPRIVIGLTPPYYPSVSNIFFDNLSCKVSNLSEELKKHSRETFGQEYKTELFFTGISDLSYTSIQNGSDVIKSLEENMPLFAHYYEIPIDCIERISMPCINIGPWGKDFHKLTERVCKEDLFNRTPELIHHAVSHMLGWK